MRALAGMGLSAPDVAIVLQLSAPTVRRHYRRELDEGAINANLKVARALFAAATDDAKPSVAAQMFWLRARAGWIEESARRNREDGGEGAVGKKAQRDREARIADNGTEWERLLAPNGAQIQ